MEIRFGSAQTTKHEDGDHVFRFGDRVLVVSDTSGATVLTFGDMTFFLEGEVYYHTANGKPKLLKGPLRKAQVENLCREDPHDFMAHVEGMYIALKVDTKRHTASLFCDALNRRQLFYRLRAGALFASTNLDRLVGDGHAGYDQHSLYSYLLVGYSPIRSTFYKGIKRLGSDEVLTLSRTGVESAVRAVVEPVVQYDRGYLDVYESILTNAVESRASAGHNVVMSSGGWDSTALLCLLAKNHEPRNLTSVVYEVILGDGKSFNVYEVDKVKRISRLYGVKTETASIDYGNKKLIDYWERSLATLRQNHVYFFLHPLALSDRAAAAAYGGSVFNGEASDSIHNFGFSQFVSVSWKNFALRAYADKGKSYLYGPTFLSKLQDGSFRSDEVFRFFREYYGPDVVRDDHLSGARSRVAAYLTSFALSYQRVPLAAWQNLNVSMPRFRDQYAAWLNREYLRDIASNIEPSNIYYYLLQLYRAFHFQSAQIAANQVGLGRRGLSCKMPFLDLQMLRFMYAMPESWGRGLELRPTKYPLRWLATERWNMPNDILTEKGPHSYIAEADPRWSYSGGKWTIQCEVLYRSVFSKYFKATLREFNVSDWFDPECFNVRWMRRVIDRYVTGEVRPQDAGFLYKLAVFRSIGLF